MKRTLAMLLSVLTLLPILISCGDSAGANAPETTAAADVQSDETAVTTEAELKPALDGIDYQGQTFHILIPSWSLYTDYYVSDGYDGDVVNDAIYERKIATEDALNIKMDDFLLVDSNKAPINQMYPKIQASVLAGAGEYDLVLTHCITHLTNLTSDGLLIDWNTVGNTDFSMPWWNSMMNESMTVNGKMYFAANDYIIPDPNAYIINKDIAADYNIAVPYEEVKNGTWTWDRLKSLTRMVSADLNGDGVYDVNDLYGLGTLLTWTSISTMYACNQFMLREEDGRMVLDINNEKMLSIVNMYYDLMLGDKSTFFVYSNDATDEEKAIFDNGHALFSIISLNETKVKRTIDLDFGILPFPKYNDAQEKYISNNWAGLMVVPLDAPDPDMTGAVSEYLGYESQKTVFPVYYDVLLNGKLARDDESKDMLDIIFSNSAYDIGLCYSNFNRLLYTCVYMIRERNSDFASYYAKEESSVQALYDSAFEVYFE